MEWFKFFGKDFMSDPKVYQLHPYHKLMYVYLLCHASDTDDGVIEYLSEYQLMSQIGLIPNDDDWSQGEGFYKKAEELGMIEYDGNCVVVLNYQKRQNTQLTGAERTKRSREKKKDLEQSDERNVGDVTDVTPIREEKSRVEKKRKEKNPTSDSHESSEDTSKVSSSPKKGTQKVFDQFWSVYPKKESKKKALDIWKRQKLDDEVKAIVKFVKAAGDTDRWKGGYIPHPTTFLNGRRWEDDLASYQDAGKPAHLSF